MVPLSKSFHNVAIFGQCSKPLQKRRRKKKTDEEKKEKDRQYKKRKTTACVKRQLNADNCSHINLTKHIDLHFIFSVVFLNTFKPSLHQFYCCTDDLYDVR